MTVSGIRDRLRDRGAVAVELALVAPLLIVLIAALVEFGQAYHAQVTLTQAAREGARIAALSVPCDATCQTNVRTRIKNASPGVTDSMIHLTDEGARLCASGDDGGDDAIVVIKHQFAFQLVFVPVLNVTLTGKAHMPCLG